MPFDWLVVGQVLATNPAHAVRGPKHVVKHGKTPVLTAKQARQLLGSIDVSTRGYDLCPLAWSPCGSRGLTTLWTSAGASTGTRKLK
jgi:hypothetical protein